MTIEMTTIHPDEDEYGHWTETYQYGFDDSCLVIRSGSDPHTPKTWVSRHMIQWIGDKGANIHERHYSKYRDGPFKPKEGKKLLLFSKIKGDSIAVQRLGDTLVFVKEDVGGVDFALEEDDDMYSPHLFYNEAGAKDLRDFLIQLYPLDDDEFLALISKLSRPTKRIALVATAAGE